MLRIICSEVKVSTAGLKIAKFTPIDLINTSVYEAAIELERT